MTLVDSIPAVSLLCQQVLPSGRPIFLSRHPLKYEVAQPVFRSAGQLGTDPVNRMVDQFTLLQYMED